MLVYSCKLLVNSLLKGLTLELATLGDLKLVEKPAPMTVGPHDFVNIKVSHVTIT